MSLSEAHSLKREEASNHQPCIHNSRSLQKFSGPQVSSFLQIHRQSLFIHSNLSSLTMREKEKKEKERRSRSNDEFKLFCTLCNDTIGFRPFDDGPKAITTCGHVFHDFCLHKWMVDKPASPKYRCPICKQKFDFEEGTQQLFFKLSSNHRVVIAEENEKEAEVVDKNERRRANEKKTSLLLPLCQNQEEQINQQSEEIRELNKLVKSKVASLEEVNKKNENTAQELKIKTEELSKVNLEILELHEKISAANKELDVLKLKVELESVEENVTELATLHHEMAIEDVVHVLKMSLISCNKKYQELKFQSDLIDKEARKTLKKYLKGQDMIDSLKEKLQELEKIHQPATSKKTTKSTDSVKANRAHLPAKKAKLSKSGEVDKAAANLK